MLAGASTGEGPGILRGHDPYNGKAVSEYSYCILIKIKTGIFGNYYLPGSALSGLHTFSLNRILYEVGTTMKKLQRVK